MYRVKSLHFELVYILLARDWKSIHETHKKYQKRGGWVLRTQNTLNELYMNY